MNVDVIIMGKLYPGVNVSPVLHSGTRQEIRDTWRHPDHEPYVDPPSGRPKRKRIQQTICPLTSAQWDREETLALAYINQEDAKRNLKDSDIAMVRVVEDLIDLLHTDGTIDEAELPDDTRLKLESRRALRATARGE